jgi:hypothetical protein
MVLGGSVQACILAAMVAFAACAAPPHELIDNSPRMVVSVGARPLWAKQERTRASFYNPDRTKFYAVGWGKAGVADQSLAIAQGQAMITVERVLGSSQGCRIKSFWENPKDGTFYALAECPLK